MIRVPSLVTASNPEVVVTHTLEPLAPASTCNSLFAGTRATSPLCSVDRTPLRSQAHVAVENEQDLFAIWSVRNSFEPGRHLEAPGTKLITAAGGSNIRVEARTVGFVRGDVGRADDGHSSLQIDR